MTDDDLPQLEYVSKELRGLDQIIDTLLNLDARVSDALFRRKLRRFLPALRTLYFTGDGLYAVLSQIEKGHVHDFSKVEDYFIGGENERIRRERVDEAIEQLLKLGDDSVVQLSIEEWDLLAGIVEIKSHVIKRAGLLFSDFEGNEVNESAQRQASEIMAAMTAVNEKIQHADKILRKRLP